MEFTCPHCGETFYAPTRKGSKSEKVKEAARRNGALGGGPPKVIFEAVREVYLQREQWTWQDFVVALKKKTGIEYSRARAFVLLKSLRNFEGNTTEHPIAKTGKAAKIENAKIMDARLALVEGRTEPENKRSVFIGSRVGRTEPQDKLFVSEVGHNKPSPAVGKKKTAKK